MRPLLRKRRMLSQAEELVYFGPPDALEAEVVARAVGSLSVSKPLLDIRPKRTVARDPEETVSWIRWYTGLQVEIYHRERAELGHDLNVLLIVARDRYQLDVVFRMSKQSFGNIQYRISVQKIEGDLFLCYEG
jgi:hypothetical protein